MIQSLGESGYLNYEKYRGIRLTDKGIKIDKSMRNRHMILTEYFRIIGADDEIANNDAKGILYHLHHETLKKLEEFMIAMKNKSTSTIDWIYIPRLLLS
jgi:Mn-dependent DtxR family transcriptional regulator